MSTVDIVQSIVTLIAVIISFLVPFFPSLGLIIFRKKLAESQKVRGLFLFSGIILIIPSFFIGAMFAVSTLMLMAGIFM